MKRMVPYSVGDGGLDGQSTASITMASRTISRTVTSKYHVSVIFLAERPSNECVGTVAAHAKADQASSVSAHDTCCSNIIAADTRH